MEQRDEWRTQSDRTKLARRARVLLAAVAANIGLAVGLLVVFTVAFARAGRPRLSVDTISVAAGVAAAIAFGAVVIRVGRSPRGGARFRRTERRATVASADLVERAAALALATGQPTPVILVFEDETINASTAGAPGSACILITDGAARLEPAQFDALLAYCLAQVASDELRAVRDASSAISLYALLVRLAIGVLIAALVAGAALDDDGAWVAVAATATFAVIVGLVCGAAATTAVLVLVSAAGALADSDAVRDTMRPDAYAELLVAMADDPRATRTKVSPLLWLERATTRDDLGAIAGSLHSQDELEQRARRMSAIAGIDLPSHWSSSDPST